MLLVNILMYGLWAVVVGGCVASVVYGVVVWMKKGGD